MNNYQNFKNILLLLFNFTYKYNTSDFDYEIFQIPHVKQVTPNIRGD